MRAHWDFAALHFSATRPQITDQLLAGIELGAGRLVAIEIADETDA